MSFDWLINWMMFNATSAISQPFKSGWCLLKTSFSSCFISLGINAFFMWEVYSHQRIKSQSDFESLESYYTSVVRLHKALSFTGGVNMILLVHNVLNMPLSDPEVSQWQLTPLQPGVKTKGNSGGGEHKGDHSWRRGGSLCT